MPTPNPTCQLPLQAAHALCQAQGQCLQPGGRLRARHFGELEVQCAGAPGEGQGRCVLLRTESHSLLLEGCPGKEGVLSAVARPPGPDLPFLHTQVSPEPGSDVLRRTQAETGFLRGTEAGHHLPSTLEPAATPQTRPTQCYLGPRANLRLQLQSPGEGAQPPSGKPHTAPFHPARGPPRRRAARGLRGPPGSPVTHEGRQAVRREAGAPELRGVRHTAGEGLSGGPAHRAARVPGAPRPVTHWRLKPPWSPAPAAFSSSQ